MQERTIHQDGLTLQTRAALESFNLQVFPLSHIRGRLKTNSSLALSFLLSLTLSINNLQDEYHRDTPAAFTFRNTIHQYITANWEIMIKRLLDASVSELDSTLSDIRRLVEDDAEWHQLVSSLSINPIITIAVIHNQAKSSRGNTSHSYQIQIEINPDNQF